MTLYTLLGKVEDDSVKELSWFLDFAEEYLDFTKFGENITPNIQADIVSQNESNYHFIQYNQCLTLFIHHYFSMSLQALYYRIQ